LKIQGQCYFPLFTLANASSESAPESLAESMPRTLMLVKQHLHLACTAIHR
jgi:hypothetical protein